MQIKILKDADYRHSPASVQAFAKDQVVDVPKAVARALIENGAAKAASAPTQTEKDKANG